MLAEHPRGTRRKQSTPSSPTRREHSEWRQPHATGTGFADDGYWLVLTKKSLMRKALYWLYLLEIHEMPISSKKVKAGLEVSWICFVLHVQKKDCNERLLGGRWAGFRDGSRRGHRQEESQEHVRPLQGPFFPWSSVVHGGVRHISYQTQ